MSVPTESIAESKSAIGSHAKAIVAIVVGRQPDQDVPEVEFQCRLRSSDVPAEVGE